MKNARKKKVIKEPVAKERPVIKTEMFFYFMAVLFVLEAAFLILRETKEYSPPVESARWFVEWPFSMTSAAPSGDMVYLVDSVANKCEIRDKVNWAITAEFSVKNPVYACALEGGSAAILCKDPSRLEIYDKAVKKETLMLKNVTIPLRVKSDTEGNLYVADLGSAKLFKINRQGSELFSIAASEDPKLSKWPGSFAVDRNQNVYMLDSEKKVRVYGKSGAYKTMWRASRMFNFNPQDDIACGPDNLLYILDRDGHRVLIYDTGGRHIARFSGGKASKNILVYPGLLVFDDGHIYITTTGQIIVLYLYGRK